MSMINLQPGYAAFETQLKTLCLNEFPCGNGIWRTNTYKKNKCVTTEPFHSSYTNAGTSEESCDQIERPEDLLDMIKDKTSPWTQDYSWSDEARDLREISIKSPWLIDDQFILSHFRTLRIVDKNVRSIDEQFLKFTNLEELTLSANFLNEVDFSNLPKSLKSVELCANAISDLGDSMKATLPNLEHLGVGYNELDDVGLPSSSSDFYDCWPRLLSLDLSHNHLCSLFATISALQGLPKLRNLVLKGNPFTLVPGYRGYTIDCLRSLDFLDDVPVSADERHHFRGLCQREESMREEAEITLAAASIKGIPIPPEIKDPENFPELPVIIRKYYVQFMFVTDLSASSDGRLATSDSGQPLLADATTRGGQQSMIDSSPVSPTSPTDTDTKTPTIREGRRSVRVNEDRAEGEDRILSRDVNSSLTNQRSSGRGSAQIDNTTSANQNAPPSCFITENKQQYDSGEQTKPNFRLLPIRSEFGRWAEEIDLNWQQVVIRRDLRAVRDFFRLGMDVELIEEKSTYNLPPESDGEQDKKSPKDDKQKNKKKTGKDDTKQKTEKNAKDLKQKKKKKKKKDGELEEGMVLIASKSTTLATFHVSLAEFLENDRLVEKTLTQKTTEGSASTRSHSPKSDRSKKGKKVDKTKSVNIKTKNQGEKDAKDKKGGKKTDKKKKGKVYVEDESALPQALEIDMTVRLNTWTKTSDCQENSANDSMQTYKVII